MQNETTFKELLDKALTEPGTISAAYTAFYGYSIGNQMLAMMQCQARDIPPGPIATFKGWKDKDRYVRKGEKALALCMPVTCKCRDTEKSDSAEPGADVFTRFVFRNNWFVLSQTDGAELAPISIPEWQADRALVALDVTRVAFDSVDGNCQGFARQRSIAISPIAALPHKTMFHELAHVMLGHTSETAELSDSEVTPRSLREVEAESVAMICCEALNLSGASEARGYIQSWNQARGNEPIPERSAQRIFKAANQILTAGRPADKAGE